MSRKEVPDRVEEASSQMPRGGLQALQDKIEYFTTKLPPPTKGETWPLHSQAALHQPGGNAFKGGNCPAILSLRKMPLATQQQGIQPTFMGVRSSFV